MIKNVDSFSNKKSPANAKGNRQKIHKTLL